MRNNKGKVYPTPISAGAGDSLTVFKLFPAAILTLATVLSLEEQQVLAYMITKSIKSTNNPSFCSTKNKKKPFNNTHNPPVFDCECFDCYTSYWFKWDSSPNRELIHQAIEAFEDHLNNESQQSKKKGKKKDKMGHRKIQTFSQDSQFEALGVQEKEDPDQVLKNEVEEELPENAVVVAAVSQHKGLTSTMLPDVLGLLNSRLWSLWSPNV